MEKQIDVFGIGQPLVDYLIQVDENFLKQNDFKKGDMQLVTSQLTSQVLKQFKTEEITTDGGGSCGNTIYGIAYLGGKVSYLGTIGSGTIGQIFRNSFNGNTTLNLPQSQELRTGHCVSLITPDRERTMLTHLGASQKLQLENLIEEDIVKAKVLHLEAYMLEIPQLKEILEYAVLVARKENTLISIDLSSPDLIKRNYEYFQEFIEDHADIVFTNQEESQAFTNKSNPREALDIIIKKCKIAIVKTGKDGSLIRSNGQFHHISPVYTNLKDTTGAGDMYAAGFLYGLTQNKELSTSGRIAGKYASKVCGQVGARLK